MIQPKYTLKVFKSEDSVPSRDQISAVFLIAFSNNKVLAGRNERGWDIPGGHLEAKEDLQSGLRREIKEEVGATFGTAEPFALLRSSNSRQVMLFYVSKSYVLGTFTPKEDALERALLSVEDLLSWYYGDKQLLRRIINEAKSRIS